MLRTRSKRSALAVRRDRYREGIKLIAAAEACLASVNVSPEPAERFLKESAIASARTFLKPDSFVAAWADGAGTNLEVAARAAIAP